MEDVKYFLVSVEYHDWTSNNTCHYFCDILDINTGIWWLCDDDIITKLRVIPDHTYSVASYPTSRNRSKKL